MGYPDIIRTTIKFKDKKQFVIERSGTELYWHDGVVRVTAGDDTFFYNLDTIESFKREILTYIEIKGTI